MRILFFCPRWGSENLSWDHFLHKCREAGYDGIEAGYPGDPAEREQLAEGLAKYGLLLIGQHWETATADFDLHKKEYAERLYALTTLMPLFINSQTGKDHFSFGENTELIGQAREIEEQTGIPVLHETHRGKFSFAAHITRGFLEALPDCRITLDISHWFAVAETYLHDQQAAVRLAIERTDHIHCRVGFPEGPQVNDPRAPEWAEALEEHLSCWDEVIARRRAEGRERFTITAEFGPSPYMPLQPFSRQPLADQWEVNVHMMQLLKSRYR